MAEQLIVFFTKPEMKDGHGKFRRCMPLIDRMPPDVWEKYRRANSMHGIDVTQLSLMQFVMRTLGGNSGFEVVSARKARFDEAVFAAHYCHTFKYTGGFNTEDGSGFALEQLVRPYAADELWFFLAYGNGETVNIVRGPTDGSKARDPKSDKYAPLTWRGLYGEFLKPMMHMTAETPCGDMMVDSSTQGIVEAIRFFEAGGRDANRLLNWPLEKGANGLYALPELKLDIPALKGLDVGTLINTVKAKFGITPQVIGELIQDFPEIGYDDIAAFFGKSADRFFKSLGIAPQEPGMIVIPKIAA